MTHIMALVVPAVWSLLVGVAHAPVAIDVDITCGWEGWVRRGAASEGRGWPSRGVWALTGWKTASKEHVEEVFRRDVSLKAPVEVPGAMAMSGRLPLVIPELVVLFPFLGVAEHGVGRADG